MDTSEHLFNVKVVTGSFGVGLLLHSYTVIRHAVSGFLPVSVCQDVTLVTKSLYFVNDSFNRKMRELSLR